MTDHTEEGGDLEEEAEEFTGWAVLKLGEGPRVSVWMRHGVAVHICQLSDGVALRAWCIATSQAKADRIAMSRVERAAILWLSDH